ncbi:MAG: hypothetical protein ACR2QT_09075 [Woeseiaceae bacterium]
MGKSTLVLVTLAALGLGALIGFSLVDEEAADVVTETATGAAAMPGAADTGGAPVYRFLSPETTSVEHDEYGQAVPGANGENHIPRDGELKTEVLEITLELDAVTEYKALMKQGDSITYRWSTDGGDAYYDFHAHDVAFGDEFFTRYAEGEGSSSGGSIVAAYDGQHGWFWLNISDAPITITLEVMGFYDEIIEIDLEGY